MTTDRIQLHSGTGRQLLLAWSYMPWVALTGCFSSVITAFIRHGFVAAQLKLFVCTVPALILLARWARRNSTPVFATPGGLELVAHGRVISWASVAAVRRMPLSGLMPIYRITFTDGTPPLTFYAQQELEQVVRRYRTSALVVERESVRSAG